MACTCWRAQPLAPRPIPRRALRPLDSPRISGTLPAALLASWRCTMQGLFLNVNAFSGPLPSEIADMSALTSLGLSGNAFTGSIPPSWGSNWPSLSWLRLDKMPNLTRQELPVRWATLTQLKDLSIAGSSFSSTIPREWGVGMRSLKLMTYDDNPQLAGCLPLQLRARNVTSWDGEPLDSQVPVGTQ